MRPLEIELEGFTSFRARTAIDFRGLDLFAITGHTGSGKTSLLDAMIYALYGKVPRLERDLNQLISRGKQTMRVRLDFAIGAAVYRVVRSSTLSTKGALTTKVQLEQKENGAWQPRAGKGGEVDDAVERLTGLDYDSFIRAVVLPQGQFDVFLKGDLRENTEVLNRLLRTQIYDRMRALAAERDTAGKQQLRDLDAELLELADATPAARAEREAALEELAARTEVLAAVELGLAGAAREAEDLARILAEAKRLEVERAQHAAAGRVAREQLAAAEGSLARGARSLAEIDRALAGIEHDDAKYVALERAEGEAARLADLTAELARTTVDEKTTAARLAALATKVKAAAAQVAARERASQAAAEAAAAARAPLDATIGRFGSARALATHLEIERARGRHATDRAEKERGLAAVRAGIAAAESRLEKARAAAQAAALDLARAEEEIAALRRTHSAAELRAHLTPGAECPVCTQVVKRVPPRVAVPPAVAAAEKAAAAARDRGRERDLDVVRLETAIAKEEEKAKQIGRDIARLAADEDLAQAKLETYLGTPPTAGTLAALEAAQAALETQETAALETEAAARRLADEMARERREHDQLVSSREIEASAAVERAKRRAEAEREQAGIHARLAAMLGGSPDQAADDLVTAARAGLAAARRAKKEHADLSAQREAVRQKLESARNDEIATRTTLAAVEKSEAETRAAAAAAAGAAAEKRQALAASAQALTLDLPPSEDGAAERAAVEAQRARVGDERTKLAARRAVVEIELVAIEKARARRAELAIEREEVASSTALAGLLAQELRADRFVTYLHEEAVLVLAADANRHLKGYLDMDFSLVVENRRFSIIDHANADERRSVRTLSGGETFTASLALAIGFAEHLTALGGAASRPHALESLFLDEGFGSLDTEHLDQVANAIEALYGRGRTVGIITHIPELAQRMPARIVVTKEGNASRVAIETG